MSQAGQGVHLGREGDPGPFRGGTGDGPEGGRQPFGSRGEVEALSQEDRVEQARCADFLEGELGIGVDLAAQVQDLGSAFFDGLGDPDVDFHG